MRPSSGLKEFSSERCRAHEEYADDSLSVILAPGAKNFKGASRRAFCDFIPRSHRERVHCPLRLRGAKYRYIDMLSGNIAEILGQWQGRGK